MIAIHGKRLVLNTAKRKILYVHHYPSIGGSAISLSLLWFEPVLLLTRGMPSRKLFEDSGMYVSASYTR